MVFYLLTEFGPAFRPLLHKPSNRVVEVADRWFGAVHPFPAEQAFSADEYTFEAQNITDIAHLRRCQRSVQRSSQLEAGVHSRAPRVAPCQRRTTEGDRRRHHADIGGVNQGHDLVTLLRESAPVYRMIAAQHDSRPGQDC